MKLKKKKYHWLKRTILSLFGLIFIAIVSLVVYMYTAPQFGKKPFGEDLLRISKSNHFSEGVFINELPTEAGSFRKALPVLPKFFTAKNLKPDEPIQSAFSDPQVRNDSTALITWFGHSAFRFIWEGKTILIDPMFGPAASPFSFGSRRFPLSMPIDLNTFDSIDAIILSHDHYDHLDYYTIIRLKDRVGHFYTPLGVGSHLKYWGIPEERITELDWWEETWLGEIRLIACPSRHFSGRGLRDRNATQWASWVLKGSEQSIYFSGDGGYGPHFKEIGEKYGPFDLGMLECGQYNLAWHDIHMLPEESVNAGIDLQAKLVMPIHWGAFNLAVHAWTDPIERFSKKCDEENLAYIHPCIGENFYLGEDYPKSCWWRQTK